MTEKDLSVGYTNFEKMLRAALELPGVGIDRAAFLRRELSKFCDDDVINEAIAKNPAQAGISNRTIDSIAKACINYETRKVSAISAVAGLPGGLAMIATVPADAAQFFGHVVRILQKLAFLYGWEDIFKKNGDGLDDETTNELTLFLGVMFGVNAANTALSRVAGLAAVGVEKMLLKQALTKGTIYPIVKKIAAIIGVKMTKATFAKGIGKVIPVVGAAASGVITLAIFKPMATRLKNYLATLPMANNDFYKKPHDVVDVGGIDFSDIEVDDTDVVELDNLENISEVDGNSIDND